MSTSKIAVAFGNSVRIRVCGIVVKEDSILLINHTKLNESGSWWSPPGGGVNFGETLQEALLREFKEETGLLIEVQKQLFITEYIESPLHAVEVFFRVKVLFGELMVGNDPELPDNKQTINEVKFVTFDELKLIGNREKHQCLKDVSSGTEVLSKKGYLLNQSKFDK